jgi:hypothetical protein
MTVDDTAFYKDSAMRHMGEAIEYLDKLDSEFSYCNEAIDAIKEAIHWMNETPIASKQPRLFTGDMPTLVELTIEDMPTDPFRYPHIRDLMRGLKHNGDRYA